MDTFEPYEPEDLETLLHEKSFDALLPEEQAFALKHIASREEYESLRELYLKLTTDRTAELVPSTDMKNRAMAAFRAKHGAGTTGRSSWFGLFNLSPWYNTGNTGMRLALALLIVALIATPLLLRQDKPELLAENKSTKEEKQNEPIMTSETTEDTMESGSTEDNIPSVAMAEMPSDTRAETENVSPVSVDANEDVVTIYKSIDIPNQRAENENADNKDMGQAENEKSNFLFYAQSADVVTAPTALSKQEAKQSKSVTMDTAIPASAAESLNEVQVNISSTAKQMEHLLKKCQVTR